MSGSQSSRAQETFYTGMPAKPVVGVLLVHGFNGSRNDMAELEGILRGHGMITVNMLLPGHGAGWRDLLETSWDDWAQAVHDELHLLKQRCDVVFLVGHSLGGALILHVAAHEESGGIVSMCAPLHMYPWLKAAVGFVKYITPFLPTVRQDIRDVEARRRYKRDASRWMPMRPMESLLRYLPQLEDELPRITAPALIMVSLHDHVVPARDGREIYRRISSREKHLVTLHRSYHVITKDNDREEVYAKTLAFIQRHAAKAKPHSKVPSTSQAD